MPENRIEIVRAADPIDDVRAALRWLSMLLLGVAALETIRAVAYAVAGEWVTAVINACIAAFAVVGWLSTAARADRYSGASWAPLDVTRARVVTRTANAEETP